MILLFCFISLIQSALVGCKTQISDTHCLECETGYYLVINENTDSGIPDLTCAEITKIANCDLMDGNACVKCQQTFYLSENTCKPCTMANCLYCNSELCFECGKDSTGKQLYLSADEKSCIDCTLAENDEECGRCQDGKYFNIQSKGCVKCMTNCALCTEGYNCFQCTNKHYLVRGNPNGDASEGSPDSCQEITDCVTEHTKEDHCELCKEGFRIDKGHCTACPTNCATCYVDENDAVKCATCKDTYFPKDGECQQVKQTSNHCEVGDKNYGCLECEAGYYFDENLDCVQCDMTICKTCVKSATHCTSCQDGYFFSGSGDSTTCVQKAGNCDEL